MYCDLAKTDFSFAVFDCDGVILDSNPIKTEAFRQALPGYPKGPVEELVEYHRQNGGISRYAKFRHFFDGIDPAPDRREYDLALERFQAYCYQQLLKCDLVPGVLEYLDHLSGSNIPMHVVSGSDQAELRDVLEKRDIKPKFGQVLGSPTSKRENLQTLLKEENLGSGGIFFGDAFLDYQIATESGLGFVLVHGYSDWADGVEFCSSKGVLCVADFLTPTPST